MLNRLIKATESITTAVLNRFVSFDHNIDGSHRPWIDARNYASLSAAIDACGAAGSKACTIAITNNQAVSSNKTVLPHVTLWFANSGRITFSGGAILTVQGGMMEMGLQQRFFGTGTVVFDTGFIERVYPQWWGAKGDGATEDTAAIQAAITAVSANALPVHCVAGNYVIDALTLPTKANLQGDGSALTKFTRKSGAASFGMNATGDAGDVVLKGFELDCDFEGTDGIRLGLSGGGVWGGLIEDIVVRDCAGINVSIFVGQATIRQLSVINADGGAVGTHQLIIVGDGVNIYDLRITGETGTTANIQIGCNNANVFGMYLEDPHLTKAIRFVGAGLVNNNIYGVTIVTEDNTNTYDQLFYFESGASQDDIYDVTIEKGASDTITNAVQDDELSLTTSNDNFFGYSQTDKLEGQPQALADNATPSVNKGNSYITGGTTTITDFDDGFVGQIITVIAEHSLTITDGTNIFLNGSGNFAMNATDTLTLIQKSDTLWYELARSDNT